VRVSAIFPGAIATNIATNSGVGIPATAPDNAHSTATAPTKKQKQYKMLPAKKASEIIVHGIEKEKFKILVGKDAKFMDFLYRRAPKFAVNLIAKQMGGLLG
jgi:short-subunit dehydrogenase